MNLQYISDSSGKTTGVFIPITEWNALKEKYEGIENEHIEIPEWQVLEVMERKLDYQKNPEKAVDFDAAMDEIDKKL